LLIWAVNAASRQSPFGAITFYNLEKLTIFCEVLFMNTIIVGAGDFGSHIANLLSNEGHNITIIEKNEERQKYIEEKIDALVLHGNGLNDRIVKKIGSIKPDLLIAVTNSDEVNLVTCMVAKNLSIKHKIARITNEDNEKTLRNLNDKVLGIDYIINPPNIVAHEICNLIHYINATEAAEFGAGRVVFASYLIQEENPIIGASLQVLDEFVDNVNFVVMAIYRAEQIVIPHGEEEVAEGDIVSFVAKKEDIETIAYLFGHETEQTKTVFILGAGEVGLKVAQNLSKEKYRIKIIDKDPKRCEEVAELLEHALVLCSDSMDGDLLVAEGIEKATVFVAATHDDQANILGALLAKRCGVNRVVAVIYRPDLIGLASSLGINACICPGLATASSVLKYIRGENVFFRGHVRTK